MTNVIQSQGEQQTQSGPNVIRLATPQRVATPRQNDRDATLFSSATGQPVEEVRPQVEAGVTAGVQSQAHTLGQSEMGSELRQSIETDETTDELLFQMLEDAQAVESVSRFLPSSMAAAIRNNVPGAREFALDRLTRLSMTSEAISERISGMTSVSGIVGNIGELLLDPLSLYHSATYRDLTHRYEALLSPTVSLEEFQVGMNEILTEAADAGFLSDNNLFFFTDFLDTLGSGVYSGTQQVQELFGVADLAITGATEVAPLIGRGARAFTSAASLASPTALTSGTVARGAAGAVRDASRDTLSLIGLMRPSQRVQQAADQTLAHHIIMDDPTNAATDISAHSHMSFATPTLTRGSYLSASSHTAARTFEENSQVLDGVMDVIHRTGSVFDEATIESFSNQMRTDRMAALREAGSRRIIDVEVGQDEFSNLFLLDITGTTRGQYFRRAQDAQRAAGFGDEVVQIAPEQYAVITRHNISADDLSTAADLGYTGDIRGMVLYRATDPDQLGDGLIARWGSPLAQADAGMSSYLFRSESVFQDALHTMRAETKRVTNGMPARQVTEVYQAFEAMANSARRESFSQQEFSSWFFDTFQREPTSQQVSLYLLQQERLDAESFITANELYRSAVTRGYEVLRQGEVEHIVRAVSAESLPDGARVYDNDAGRLMASGEDIGDRQVYRNVGSSELPADVQYVVGSADDIRAVRHSDFIVRNAGGHRSYVVGEMQYLLKQRNTRTYSDGTARELAPRTMLGARTPEEARQAMTDINNIIDEVIRVVNPGNITDEAFDNMLTGYRRNRELDAAVRANNGFNPGITNFDELVDFAKARGISLRTRFEVVAEGQAMESFLDVTSNLDDFAFALRGASYGDNARMTAIRGGRGSLPLAKYGGGSIATRPTQDVLEGAYISAQARATEAAYRIRNFNGIIKAALEAQVLKVDYATIANLPIRTQIERILRDGLIDTTGARGAKANIGGRLQLDLERLQFRLQQQSATTRIFNRAYRSMANYLYGHKRVNSFAKVATLGRVSYDKADRWSRDPVSALRGWAFDVYLGMFNPSQLLMQGSQVINIMGIAGLNGIKATALAPVFRFVMSNGHDEVLERVARLTESITGLNADDWRTMVRMFRESGRHIVDNNIAELTMAEDAMGNFASRTIGPAVRNFREAGRVFYKEGDLAARITAFMTSYMEYVAKNGRITNPRNQRAINAITHREQVLTQGMTSASRQAYEQLPFMQFMTYNLRMTEALFAGTFNNSKSVLTGAEKARLASTHFAIWGAYASAPTYLLAQYLESNYNMEDVPEDMLRAFRSGALDALVSMVTGSDTAIGSRFGMGQGWSDTIRSFAEEGLLTTLMGPSGQLGLQTGRVGLSTMYNAINSIVTGDFTHTQDDLIELARFTSSGNYTFNAYTAFRFGEYLSRKGSLVTEDLTAMDSVFLLFGIPLEEIQSIYRYQGDRQFRRRWLSSTVVPQLNTLYENMWTAARRDDMERVQSYMRQIAITENALDPWERSIVDARVNPDFRSARDSLMLELAIRDVQMLENVQ